MDGFVFHERIRSEAKPEEVFAILSKERHSFFLDSALKRKEWGSFSYIGFEPSSVIRAKDGVVESLKNGRKIAVRCACALDALAELLEGEKRHLECGADPPFKGGLVGFISYDYGLSLKNLQASRKEYEFETPDLEFGFYDFVAVYDHFKNEYMLLWLNEDGREKKEFVKGLLKKPYKWKSTGRDIKGVASIGSAMSREEYLDGARRVKEYIRDGYVYVLNLANCFHFKGEPDALKTYLTLRKSSAADFSAYLNFGDTKILSVSPESFIRIRGRKITSKPIKGTRKRGRSPAEDRRERHNLERDPKERAELAMIVDMVRNDIGQVCRTGSVAVRHFARAEAYPSVFQLVGLVEGELLEGAGLKDVLKAVFPGGSITGAPKFSALKIIDELENFKRGVYTGSIGFFSVCGNADLNIAIRTLVLNQDRGYYGAGSGITIDSDEEREHEETILKAKGFFDCFGAVLNG